MQDHFEVWAKAAGGADGDGLISQEDIYAMVSDPSATEQDRLAAWYLQYHPEFFSQLESQLTGVRDKLLGKTDMQVWKFRREPGDPVVDAANTLLAHFYELDQARTPEWDGLFDLEDVKAIQADPKTSHEMKSAVSYILNFSGVFDQLDSALQPSQLDGNVSYMDVSQWLLQHKTETSL